MVVSESAVDALLRPQLDLVSRMPTDIRQDLKVRMLFIESAMGREA